MGYTIISGRGLEERQVVDPHRVAGGGDGFVPSREFPPRPINSEYTTRPIDDYARVRQRLDEGSQQAIIQAWRYSTGVHFSLPLRTLG